MGLAFDRREAWMRSCLQNQILIYFQNVFNDNVDLILNNPGYSER